MPVDCDPSSLSGAAACYCYDATTQRAVVILLLREIAGSTLTPDQLAAAARCFCYDEKTAMAIQNMLLCEISNAVE